MDERRARFEQLYNAHAAEIAGYAARRAGAELAQDVVADTFLVAWRRLDAVPDEPLPWLYGVARKTLANYRRSAKRRQSLVSRLRQAEPALPALDDTELETALRRLGERDREILMLVAWEGLAPAEAAVALGCSPVAARLRLHRARKRLADALGVEAPRTRASANEPRVKEAS